MIPPKRCSYLALLVLLAACDASPEPPISEESHLVSGYYQIGAMVPSGADTVRGSGILSIEVTSDSGFAGQYSFDESLGSVLGQRGGRIVEGSLDGSRLSMRFGGAASSGEFQVADSTSGILRGSLTSVAFGTEESFEATLTLTREHLEGDYVFDLRYQRSAGSVQGIMVGLLTGSEVDASTLTLKGKLATYERRDESSLPYARVGELEEVDRNVNLDDDGGFRLNLPLRGTVQCSGDNYQRAGFYGTCDFGGVDSQIKFGLRRFATPLQIANLPMAGKDTLGGSRYLHGLHTRSWRNRHSQTGLTAPARRIEWGELLFRGPDSVSGSISHTYVPAIGSQLSESFEVELPTRATAMVRDPARGALVVAGPAIFSIDEEQQQVSQVLEVPEDAHPSLFGSPFTAHGLVVMGDTIVTVGAAELDTLFVQGLRESNPLMTTVRHAAWTTQDSSVLWTLTYRSDTGVEDPGTNWYEIGRWDGREWEVAELETLGPGFPLSSHQYLSYRRFCPNPDRPVESFDSGSGRLTSNCNVADRRTEITVISADLSTSSTVVDREIEAGDMFLGLDGRIYGKSDGCLHRFNTEDFSIGETVADLGRWPSDRSPKVNWIEVFADGEVQVFVSPGILLTTDVR